VLIQVFFMIRFVLLVSIIFVIFRVSLSATWSLEVSKLMLSDFDTPNHHKKRKKLS